MVTFVSTNWVAERIGSSDILLLDPRKPTRYLQGHLQNAVNVPLTGAFGADGGLLPVESLERWLGAAGVDGKRAPVIYDAHDGQNGAMLAWILEYLGCPNVCLVETFLGGWVAQSRALFYRPVVPKARQFSAQANPRIRATLPEVARASGVKLLDLRSQEEYCGKVKGDGRPGHIPRAINLDWREMVGENHCYLATPGKLERLLAAANIDKGDAVIAYCQMGVRAAVGYLALRQLDINVRLYDGSYAEWARTDLPVESG